MIDDKVEDPTLRGYFTDVVAGVVGVCVLSIAFAFYHSCTSKPPVNEPMPAPAATPTPSQIYFPTPVPTYDFP